MLVDENTLDLILSGEMENVDHICTICGRYKFKMNGKKERCFACGWESDGKDENYNGSGMSFYDYKTRYEYYLKQNPEYTWVIDKYPEVEQVAEVECPICHKYTFGPLLWIEYLLGSTADSELCPKCGWRYSNKQLQHLDDTDSPEYLAIEKYREEYNEKIKEDPNYEYYPNTEHLCPVCEKYMFYQKNSFCTCEECGWEDIEDNSAMVDAYRREYKKRLERDKDLHIGDT